MRFALLGDHPDGLDLARALAESGRHELAEYSGPLAGLERLRHWDIQVSNVPDLEEVLANPAIEAIIVAGPPGDRSQQLKRALQSERHVLCVHPAGPTADVAHEASMMQGDSGKVLLPMLPDALHPTFDRLRQLLAASKGFRLLEVERWASEEILLPADDPVHKFSLPGWDVLRALRGEIAEFVAFSAREEMLASEPLLLSGRFERGGLFQATFIPQQPENRLRFTAFSTDQQFNLDFPEGWPGPARLTYRDELGQEKDEHFPAWHPWPALIEAFETALERGRPAVTWSDAVRCLELDDAARRSVERRRASTLEYQEATEEAGFKGTMTLLGCGLLWGSVLLLILSWWLPWLGYLIVPVFVVFLGLQLLRWVVPAKPDAVAPPKEEPRP